MSLTATADLKGMVQGATDRKLKLFYEVVRSSHKGTQVASADVAPKKRRKVVGAGHAKKATTTSRT